MKTQNKIYLGFARYAVVILLIALLCGLIEKVFGEYTSIPILLFMVATGASFFYAFGYDNSPSPRQLKKENEKLKSELEKYHK